MAFSRILPLIFYAGVWLVWLPSPCLSVGGPALIHSPNRCLWFGQCGASIYTGNYTCLYNDRPKNVTEQGPDFFKLLNETCPKLVQEDRGVCCDMGQLNALATQIKIPQSLFSRCPACLRNFIDHFCLTTCDPDQSGWMNISANGSVPYKDNKVSITSVDIFISEDYANRLYNSCKNVQYPQFSTKVIDLMCGTTECSPKKWLKYLGNAAANNESPFVMNYSIINNGSLYGGLFAKSYDYMECNTTDLDYQCSCSDCNAPNVCPSLPQASPNTFPYFEITIIVVSVGAGLSVLIFIVALIAAIISLACKRGYTKIGGSSGIVRKSRDHYGAIEDDDNDLQTSSVSSINADAEEVPANQTDSVDIPPPHRSILRCWFQLGSWIEYAIKNAFYHWGKFVAQYWYIVFFFVGIIALALSFGLFFFKITTNPVDLWSSPTSRAREEKAYFDKNFNPFYRTEMIIVTAPEYNYSMYQPYDVEDVFEYGPVFNLEVLKEVFYLQDYLEHMEVPYTDDNGTEANITLSNICYSPLAPQNTNCTITSVLNYFQNSLDNLEKQLDFDTADYRDHVYYCTRNPTSPKGNKFPDMPCLGAFGGPVDPDVALGGFSLEPSGSPDYQTAEALIITFIVNNHLDESANRMAETWEKAFLEYLHNYNSTNIDITYSAERSIEDEIERESQAEIITILISYLLMFVYITFFLGHIRSIKTLLVDMKISIGFIGVLMVLVAVVSSIGLLSYIGVMNTLIILEVVPFLVLAVGVDNFFILIHSYEREACKFAKHHKGDLSRVCVKELIGRSVGEVAPSLLLTSLSETAAFLLGGVSNMPAVRSFSFYAGVAVFFNFLLQISVFVGLMALDAHRQIANRVDVFFCIKLKGVFDPRQGLDVIHFIMKYFARLILHPLVRPFVLLFFGLTSTASLAMLFRVKIGLEETLALPKDSYLMPYFDETFTYLHAGAPVYFVIKEGYNYTDIKKQNFICSGAGCDENSLGQQIVQYSAASNLTKIAEPAMLWLDTYFEWMAPKSYCCGVSRDDGDEECYDPQWLNDSCDPCMASGDRPNRTVFETYLDWFLHDNPGLDCAAGGHAAFGGAVVVNKTEKDGRNITTALTSYVMTYHTVLKTSADFISALRWARQLADNVSALMDWDVYPYSVFYVYYEQYLSTVHDMAFNIGLSIAAVFFVTILMFGLNVWAAAILMLVVCMIILHMFGCMHLLGINANAVSLVNLVMTVGISVEFCSHIVRWFVSHTGRRRERAQSALDHMGASVFSGITVTKFLGVFVLLFAKSRLFNIYYFRMYMMMLFWGALHGLIFLPVILSYIGPPNVPFTKKPYRDLDLEVEEPSQTSSARAQSNERRPVDSQQPPQPTLYPTLPSNTDPAPPPIGAHHNQSHGGYGAPTYPNQQVYQQQGVPYGGSGQATADERTRLINH